MLLNITCQQARHNNTSIKSVVSVSRKYIPVSNFRRSHDIFDLSDVNSFYQKRSHERTISVASFIVNVVIERRLGGRQEWNKFQVSLKGNIKFMKYILISDFAIEIV
jgi:hypothetical protein